MRFSLVLVLVLASSLTAADDLDRLIEAGKPPVLYPAYKPAFTVAKASFAQAKAQGEEQKEFWVVRDAGKAIAVLDEGACQLDWIGPRLDQAVEKLELPRVYSWANLLGCRISTVAWIDGQGASGDTRSHTWEGGGETISLVVSETWSKKRQGDSAYRFILRVDPQLGYLWDVSTRVSVDKLELRKDKLVRDIELLNVQPAHLSNPWPDRWRYDRTIISLAGADSYLGFASNLVAADRSDNNGRLKMRDQGLTAFVADAKGWGLVLARGDSGGAEVAPNSTCNVWMDQHNRMLFPAQPDAQGRHVIDARWRWAGLPPQVVGELDKRTKLIEFGDRAVMLRLGIDEHFDDQPLALDTPARGLWTWGLEVDGTHARSGGKALLLKGVEKPDGNTGRFIAPFIPLDSNAAYRLEAWVWVEGGPEAGFFMCSGDPKAEEGAMRGRTTNRVATKGEWQQVAWDIKGRGNIDLRLVLLGKGAKAWVDDFSFKRLP